MSFLNCIPVIGHAKGLLHYAVGDKISGHKAMIESTRSTVVVAGGAVGALAGPAGAIAGATAAGALNDCVTSVATGRPQGIVDGVADICEDVSNGKVPVGSVFKTGLTVGTDALSGWGAGGIANAVTGSLATSTGKNVAKQVAIDVIKQGGVSNVAKITANSGVGMMLDEEVMVKHYEPFPRPERYYQYTRITRRDIYEAGASGGDEPPRRNDDDRRREHYEPETIESAMDLFLEIFGAKTLDNICISGVYLFKGLSSGQKNTLKNLLRNLLKNGINPRQVLTTVLKVLQRMEVKDITFANFLSLAEFVMAYLTELLADRNAEYIGLEHTGLSDDYEERMGQIMDIIFHEVNIVDVIWKLLKTLWEIISKHSCDPAFRNILCAMYHYLKHKSIPGQSGQLSDDEYFDLIELMMGILKETSQYKDLKNGKIKKIEFERFFKKFNRRVKIVIKINNDGKLELASLYIVTKFFEGDVDGDEYINGVKRGGCF